MLKYRIVQDNMTEHYTVEEYNSPRVVGLGRDPDLH
jgi:hypothetical protein